jgi:hypothetical protein
MNNFTLSGDRISHVDEEFMRTNKMVRHPSSTMWKHLSKILKVSLSRPFEADWELKIAFILFFEILLMIIFTLFNVKGL